MAVNPAFPPVPEPLADLQALVAVTRALKQRVDALTTYVGALTQGGTVVSPTGSTGGSGGGGGGGGYILPVASTVTLGGVVVDGTSVTMTGPVLSANIPSPAADIPVMSGGSGAVGTGNDYARENHQHPHDTSNPENYQNAGDVALSIASSAYVLTTVKFGALDLTTLPPVDMGALTGTGEKFVAAQAGVTKIWTFTDLFPVIASYSDFLSPNPLDAPAASSDYGRNVSLIAGKGDGSSGGGGAYLISGAGGDTGDGGLIDLEAGWGGGTSGSGGNITILAGSAPTSGSGGNITITAGGGDGTLAAGTTNLITGPAPVTGAYAGLNIDPNTQATLSGPSIAISLGGYPSSNLILFGVPTADTAVADSVWWDNGVLVRTGDSLATVFAATDFSGLPAADPGGGKPWRNGGVLQVGP